MEFQLCNKAAHQSHESHGPLHTVEVFKKGPSVHPANNFDAAHDARTLREALEKFQVDNDAIFSVVCHRSSGQRQEVLHDYHRIYNRDLIEDIKSKTRGNFEKILLALLTPLTEFYVQKLRKAIDIMTYVYEEVDPVLVDILCCLSNKEIVEVKNLYFRTYQSALGEDLMSITLGPFKKLLKTLCSATRDESDEINMKTIGQDVHDLYHAGTDKNVYVRIICERNFAQLKLISEEYKKLTGHTLEQTILKEFPDETGRGLQHLLRLAKNRIEFYAARLHQSMSGSEVDDELLIRLIVSRCEIDMVEIKEVYHRKYGRTLKNDLKRDDTGRFLQLFTI
jgi:annexin A7/11